MGRGHIGAHQGLEAPVGADRKVPGVGQRLGQEARAGDGVVDLGLGPRAGPVLGERGRELGVEFAPRVVRQQLVGHVALRLGLRKVIREIHVPEGVCDLLIDFGLSVDVEQRGDDLGVDLAAVVIARQSRADGRGHRAAGGVVGQLARNEARDLRLGPVGEQGLVDQELHPPGVLVLADVQSVDGVRDGRVHLRGAAVGSQGIGDGRAGLHRGAVGGQRGQDLVADPDLAGQRRQQGVGFRLAVRIAAEAQGPVVVGELDAQRACGVQVSNLVGAGQQVPGHVAQPGGGVDQVGGAAEGGDLCEDPVDGEGPGVLEGQYLRVVPVEAGVLEGLSGLVGRLRQIAQERRGHPLIHVGRGLPGGHVDGQLVHHALQRIGRRDRRQGGVVGGGDAGVHRCCRRMVRQLEVHRGRRGFAVDLDLQGVQGGLVGLTGQAQGQTGVDRSEAGSVGRDEALCCGEVRSQSVGGEIRNYGQGGHLALQGRDGGRCPRCSGWWFRAACRPSRRWRAALRRCLAARSPEALSRRRRGSGR